MSKTHGATCSPDRRRKLAYLLFADGGRYDTIAKELGVTSKTLSTWKKLDDWDGQLKRQEERYRAKLAEKLAESRAEKDAKALTLAIDARETLLALLIAKSDRLYPNEIGSAIRAVQDVASKIAPSVSDDDDATPPEIIGFDVVIVDNSLSKTGDADAS